MALDSYSPCPGGRDKKIRFCCPDLLKELQQIETMIQNGQPSAGLALIERLEKDRPDCACLTAAKCVMLRQSGRWEEFAETAEKYLHKGSSVYVQGKMRTRSYEAQDGSKRYITEIEGEVMQMLDAAPNSQNTQENIANTSGYGGYPTPEPKDDLPF